MEEVRNDPLWKEAKLLQALGLKFMEWELEPIGQILMESAGRIATVACMEDNQGDENRQGGQVFQPVHPNQGQVDMPEVSQEV